MEITRKLRELERECRYNIFCPIRLNDAVCRGKEGDFRNCPTYRRYEENPGLLTGDSRRLSMLVR